MGPEACSECKQAIVRPPGLAQPRGKVEEGGIGIWYARKHPLIWKHF
jgi:hypothetical protein